jgi:hypothetical protein
VSFQITVLKVLAGHPDGRASLADLKRAVAILISSGSDWTDRTRRMAARAPGLDIFSQLLVLRDDAGWQITDGGRAFLASVEAPIQKAGSEQPREIVVATAPHRPRRGQLEQKAGAGRDIGGTENDRARPHRFLAS